MSQDTGMRPFDALNMNTSTWHIGIDAGGTGTELLATSPSVEADVHLEGPGANLKRLGLDRTCEVLAELLRRFRKEAGPGAASMCAGISGAGRPDEQQAVYDGLRERLGRTELVHLHIVHDGEIALEGAFEGESGVITITGTGSLVLGRTRDRTLLRVGGWGYLLGDDGSGYALGRAGLRAVAAHHDGGPATQLAALLEARHGIADNDTLIQRLYASEWPIQQAAPLVVEAAAGGDDVARRLVRHAAQALARQVRWLADRDAPLNEQVAPIGGLVNETYYRDVLYEALHAALPGWSVAPPAHPPVMGAVLMAQRMTGAEP